MRSAGARCCTSRPTARRRVRPGQRPARGLGVRSVRPRAARRLSDRVRRPTLLGRRPRQFRLHSLDCGGTPVLSGGCRHFSSLQGGVAPDQALAARDSWRGDLLQGPVAQGQPFHSSARTPRPGAPTETSCQVPLWRLPFACQAGDTSPTVIVCLHRLRLRRRQGLRLRADGNGRGLDGPTGTLCQASGGPGPTPGLRPCRSWWCR